MTTEIFTQANCPLVSFQNVSLTVPLSTQYRLHNISCEILAGDRLAVIGPSGAGKSSLLRLINQLETPTSGSIHYHPQQLAHQSVMQLRRRVMLVPQEPKLLNQTVEQTLAYPLRLAQMSPTKIRAQFDYRCRQLQIPEDWLPRRESQLSLGQRQWVAIARALMLQPPVLLLDEPTSALDLGTAQRLLKHLFQLSEQGVAIVMVNHQLEIAQQFATRVLYLQNGKLSPLVNEPPDWTELASRLTQAAAQTDAEWE